MSNGNLKLMPLMEAAPHLHKLPRYLIGSLLLVFYTVFHIRFVLVATSSSFSCTSHDDVCTETYGSLHILFFLGWYIRFFITVCTIDGTSWHLCLMQLHMKIYIIGSILYWKKNYPSLRTFILVMVVFGWPYVTVVFVPSVTSNQF